MLPFKLMRFCICYLDCFVRYLEMFQIILSYKLVITEIFIVYFLQGHLLHSDLDNCQFELLMIP